MPSCNSRSSSSARCASATRGATARSGAGPARRGHPAAAIAGDHQLAEEEAQGAAPAGQSRRRTPRAPGRGRPAEGGGLRGVVNGDKLQGFGGSGLCLPARHPRHTTVQEDRRERRQTDQRSGSPCPTAPSADWPAGSTGAQLAAAIGPGLARAAVAARVNGAGAGPRPRAPRRRSRVDPHRTRSRRPRGAASFGGAHPRHRGARDLPARRHRLRPRHRRRLLLRLRGAAPVHARRPRLHRGGDGRVSSRRTIRSCAKWSLATRPTRASPTIRSSSKGSANWAPTRPSPSTPMGRSSISAAGRTFPAPGGSSTSSC